MFVFGCVRLPAFSFSLKSMKKCDLRPVRFVNSFLVLCFVLQTTADYNKARFSRLGCE